MALQLLSFFVASSSELTVVSVVEILAIRGRCVVARVDGCWKRESDAGVPGFSEREIASGRERALQREK